MKFRLGDVIRLKSNYNHAYLSEFPKGIDDVAWNSRNKIPFIQSGDFAIVLEIYEEFNGTQRMQVLVTPSNNKPPFLAYAIGPWFEALS